MNNPHITRPLNALIEGVLTFAVFATLLLAFLLAFDRLVPPWSWQEALLAWGLMSVAVVFGPLLLRGFVQYLRSIGALRL